MLQKIKWHLFVVCLLSHSLCFGQVPNVPKSTFLKRYEEARGKDLTSLKTNTLAEILQASINSGIITTKGTDINIKSTIFQLKKIWNPLIVTEESYKKQTFARNFEFGIGVKIDNYNKINGFGSSFKYAIINNRDISNYNLKKNYVKKEYDKLNASIGALSQVLHDKIALKIEAALRSKTFIDQDKDGSQQIKILAALDTFNNHSNDANAFKDLEGKLIPFNMPGINHSTFETTNYSEVNNEIIKAAKNLEDQIKKGGLLTLAFSSNYKGKSWDSLTINLEYIKGLGNKPDKEKPWDIYATAFCDFKQDTVKKTALGRQVFTAKLGLNKVLIKNRVEGNSFLEILGAAEYSNILRGRYAKEDQTVFTVDFTLSIRLTKTLFLPFEIKYDPKNANVFGFLKVKWDLPRSHDKG